MEGTNSWLIFANDFLYIAGLKIMCWTFTEEDCSIPILAEADAKRTSADMRKGRQRMRPWISSPRTLGSARRPPWRKPLMRGAELDRGVRDAWLDRGERVGGRLEGRPLLPRGNHCSFFPTTVLTLKPQTIRARCSCLHAVLAVDELADVAQMSN
jgi:hypothetical protein